MRFRQGRCVLALLGALELVPACGDDDCVYDRKSACAVGTLFNEKTCQCEPHPDASAEGAAR